MYLLQRKATRSAPDWARRRAGFTGALRQRGVEFLRGVTYKSVEDDGFHVEWPPSAPRRTDACDWVGSRPSTSVARARGELKRHDRPHACAGQTPVDGPSTSPAMALRPVSIGGPTRRRSSKRAIDCGRALATRIEDAAPGSGGMPVGGRRGRRRLQRNAVNGAQF